MTVKRNGMKKSTATESMSSYHSRFGLDDDSEDAMREKIATVSSGLEYMDEPWKGRLKSICNDWEAGRISTKECYDEIKDIEYKQSVSVKNTKKSKKSKGIKKNLEGALVMVKDEWLNPGEPSIPYVVVQDYGDGRITMKPLPQYTRGRMISPEETTMAEYVRVIDDNIVGKMRKSIVPNGYSIEDVYYAQCGTEKGAYLNRVKTFYDEYHRRVKILTEKHPDWELDGIAVALMEWDDANSIETDIDDEDFEELMQIVAEMQSKDYNGLLRSAKKSTQSIHDMIAQTRQNNNSLKKSRVDLNHISKSSEREGRLRDVIRRETECSPSANSEFWWSLEPLSDVTYLMSYDGTDYGKTLVKYIIKALPNYDFKLFRQEDGALYIEDVLIEDRSMDLTDQPVLVTTMSEGSMSMTLGEAIERFGIESEGDPNDYRLFARCPKLKGLCGPVYPNEGYIARYDDWEVYDMLTR